MNKERGYYMQVAGQFTIKSKEWIDGNFDEVELVLQKEINKALRFINSKFKCEIEVHEITNILNCGLKKEYGIMRNDIVQEHDRIIGECVTELNDMLYHVHAYIPKMIMELDIEEAKEQAKENEEEEWPPVVYSDLLEESITANLRLASQTIFYIQSTEYAWGHKKTVPRLMVVASLLKCCIVQLESNTDVEEYAGVFLMQLKYIHEMVSHHINVLWG